MDDNEFHVKYRTEDAKWHPFDTLSGQQITFESIDSAEAIVQAIVSIAGVTEGVVLNQADIVVQHWRYHWDSQKPELVEGPANDKPKAN